MQGILTGRFLLPVGAVAATLPYALPTSVFGWILLANTTLMAAGAAWSLFLVPQRTRLPIALITLAGTVMIGMNLDWAIREGATGPAGSIAASISSCIFVAAGAAILAARRPRHYREGLLDGIAALVGLGAVQWQWSGASHLADLGEVAAVVVPVSGAVLFAALLAVIWRLLFDRQQNRRVITAMLMANIGQGVSAFVTTSWSDPSAPRWGYSIAMVISWLAVGAFVHPDFARVVEPEPQYERRWNVMRWLGPTSALLFCPAVTVALVARHEAPSLPVAAATVLVTAVVVVRISRFLREREAVRRELEVREQRFRSLVQHGSDVIAVLDGQGVIRYVSGGVEQLLGVPAEALVGQPADLLVADDYREKLQAALLRPPVAGELVIPRSDVRLRRPDDVVRWVSVRLTCHVGTPGINGWVLNVHDTTDRKLAEEALSRMALYDPLTGLPNRAQLRDRLGDCLREAPGTTAVLFCDLDGFKEVNDRLGHEVGDEVLRLVAGRWSGILRRDDILGRWGGDEFLVVCPGLLSPEVASHIADRLLAALDEPLELRGAAAQLGCSIGLTLHRAEESVDSLIGRADAAMYVAKRGRAGLQIS